MTYQVQKFGNPQGKGVVGILEDLHACAPSHIQAKSSHQWLADYFTSTLVLGAKYSFRPVIDKDYYLYYKNQEWKLSLIEPQAWRSYNPGIFFSKCTLNKDMSWSLSLSSEWKIYPVVVKAVKDLEQAFIQCISDETPLVEKLPFFMGQLSHYQRLGSNALARSLKQSLELKIGKQESLKLVGNVLLKDLAGSNIALLKNLI
jgi:hypothetical protein